MCRADRIPLCAGSCHAMRASSRQSKVAAMLTVETEVDRFLTLLRNKIRERGFTQLQVQEALGWGRSYISQLLTKQKALRVEQMLLILSVVELDPREFFQELYAISLYPAPRDAEEKAELRRQLEDVRAVVHGLTDLLLGEKVITAEELSSAVESVSREPDADDLQVPRA